MNLSLLDIDLKEDVDNDAESSEAENDVPEFNWYDLVKADRWKYHLNCLNLVFEDSFRFHAVRRFKFCEIDL